MKIITSVVNNPDFIEIQYYTFKKFFKGEYEFIVFNDSKDYPDFTNDNDPTLKKQIEEMCIKLNIKCINIPNNHHKYLNMSRRHADTFNTHVIKYQIENPDKYLLIDSDMFLVDHFDINKYSNYECAILLQTRCNYTLNYIWPGICYLDMLKIKNPELLNWDVSPKCDSGGMMQAFLKIQMGDNPIPGKLTEPLVNYNTDKVYFINSLLSESWNLSTIPMVV